MTWRSRPIVKSRAPNSGEKEWSPGTVPFLKPVGIMALCARVPLLLLFLLSGHFPCTLGFNLDTDEPVVKKGPEGSHFGYSVAQHQIMHHGISVVRENVLIVGAPKSENPYQQWVALPGAVYKCRMTTNDRDCRIVQVDTADIAEDRNRTGQFLGATVRSMGPGGKVMACAPKYRDVYTRGEVKVWERGRCYQLNQELVPDIHHTSQGIWNLCDDLPAGHAMYGYCHLGTALEFSHDGQDVMIAAPGAFHWTGMMFVTSMSDLSLDLTVYQSGRANFDDFGLDTSSLLGSSLSSGFFRAGELEYVAGAPRAGDIGAVVFFAKTYFELEVRLVMHGYQVASAFGFAICGLDLNGDGLTDLAVSAPQYTDSNTGGAVYVYINGAKGINGSDPIVLTGPRSSMFGYSLIDAGDVNMDGFNDLVVGAPYEDNGAVYLYLGNQHHGLSTTPSQKIMASDLLVPGLKSFGFSLSGGLDLDENGFPDVAVGAFESDHVILLRSRTALTIEAKISGPTYPVDPKRRTCDLNGKSYTCFQIKFGFRYSTSSPFDNDIDLTYRLDGDSIYHDWGLGPRLFFPGEGKSVFEGSVRVPRQGAKTWAERTITAYLKPDTMAILHPLRVNLTWALWKPSSNNKLFSVPGYRLSSLDGRPILNLLQRQYKKVEIDFVKECGADSVCISNLKLQAQLLLFGNPPTFSLGSSREIRAEIQVDNEDGEPAYNTELRVHLPERLFYAGMIEHSSGQTRVSCRTVEDNSSVVICEIGNPVSKSSIQLFTLRLLTTMLRPWDTSLKIPLTLTTMSSDSNTSDNSVILKAKVVVDVDLSITGISHPRQVLYGGEQRGLSAMEYQAQIGTAVNHTYVIRNHGRGTAPGAVVRITWPYEIQNTQLHPNGKLLLYMTDVKLVGRGRCFPPEEHRNSLNLKPGDRPRLLTAPRQGTIDRQRWRVHVSRTLRKKADGREPRSLEDDFEEDDFEEDDFEEEDYFEEESGEANPDPYEEKQREGVVTLDCMSGTARCFEFNCTLDTLLVNRSVVITVEARLWNTTFTQEYPSASHVDILSHAEVELVKNFENMQQSRSFNDKASVLTKALPESRPVSLAEQVEVWAVLLGLLLGLLLLLLIALCLWKCGFFRRVSVREQYEAKYYTATKIPRAKVIETNFSPSYYESSIYDASKYETSFQ
ncbi:integrin alpha-6-like [Branchiostoma floridae]|uniref:Integrin alpha-6-like n=1 Tax=Branchiostoma floridae TaxID=7739 RepID=A0A9J7N1H7_BRAFL|nr:integrin alpha-6-like [Branchiostoma floridae]